MYTDQAWDEYLSTGIDPTGGCLGPDFDPDTGKYLDEIEEDEDLDTDVEPQENVLAKVPYSTDPDDLHRMSKLTKNGPQYLFFDTETTGLPYYDDISAEASPDNWPRLVQLSWIMTDSEGNITKEMNKFVIPDGFVIPTDATEIHGISTEYANYWGERLERVLNVFNKSLRKADYIVCHNTWFDTNVILGEMKRMNIPTTIMEKKSFCTMLSGTDLCAIEWDGEGYKWPTLQELHTYLFREGFSDAHDALADVKAVARCFWEMKNRCSVIQNTQIVNGPRYTPKPSSSRNHYKVARRRFRITIYALVVLLIGIGIYDRIEKHMAKQEELFWEEYYANRKHETVETFQYQQVEETKPYDPQADAPSPNFTAPDYRKGSNNSGNLRKNYTPYKRGYWDGYDEGYDDRVQGMGYGYKYDCDGESYEYQQGYAKGYREGFSEGWEEYDAFGDDGY